MLAGFVLYSPALRPVFPVALVVVCTPVGGCIEPNPRAARPRAARARSGDSPAPGEIQEKVRGRHQSRQRADDAGRERTSPWFPDLVLQSQERARKLLGVVEVETAESVNHLEAMSQWATFSKLRAPFHLYVPTGRHRQRAAARARTSDVNVAEIWAYQPSATRFGSRSCSDRRLPQHGLRRAAPNRPRSPAAAASRETRAAAQPAVAVRPAGRERRRRGSRTCPSHRRAAAPAPAAAARRESPPARRPSLPRDVRPRRRRRLARPRPVGPVPEAPVSRRAVPAGHSRQARVRDHVPDALVSRREPAAFADPVRVPLAGRRARRPRADRARGPPPDRGAASRYRRSTGRSCARTSRSSRRRPNRAGGGRRDRKRVRPDAGSRSRSCERRPRCPPRRRGPPLPAKIEGDTPDAQIAFLTELYPIVRERIPQRTPDPARQEVLLTLAERLNPADVDRRRSDHDRPAAGGRGARAAVACFAKRRRRPRKKPRRTEPRRCIGHAGRRDRGGAGRA